MRPVHVTRWVLVALLCATSARSAHAEDDLLARLPRPQNSQAHGHVVAGNAYYRTREFEKALSEYERALQAEGSAAAGSAVVLYNIGQCHRHLGHWQEEIWVFRRFLAAKPEPELAARVEGFIKDAEQQLGAAKASEPATAAPPAPPPIAPMLSPSVAAAPTRGAPLTTPGVTAPATTAAHGKPWYRNPWGWGAVGLGVTGLTVGGWLVLDARRLDDQSKASDMQSLKKALDDQATTRRVSGSIIGVAGAAALTTGVVLLIVHSGDHAEPAVISWHVSVGPRGVALAGQF